MQDIRDYSARLSARWEEQVPYSGTRQFSKCLANVVDLLLVPSPGPAVAPPDEIVEVDQEEGGNPDQKLSHGRRAPPFDAAEPGGSPRPSPVADGAGSDGAGHGEGQTSLSACQSMGAERTKAGTRGASSTKDERLRCRVMQQGL